MKRTTRIPAVAAFLLLAAAPLGAANIYVSPAGGGDGSLASPTDLQTALSDAAASGANDTLFLQQGTYAAAATFAYAATGSGAGSLLVSGGWNAAYTYQSWDPAQTVLDGQGARRVLRIAAAGAGVDATVTLRSLTVRNGRTDEYAAPPGDTGSGAGISAVNTGGARLRLIMEWCDVLDNATVHPGSRGGGLLLTCEARLSHVNVRRNLTRKAGGGLLATYAPPYTRSLAPVIEHSMFWGNRAYDDATTDYAGSHVATDAAPVFRNTVFSGLGAAPGGSGVLSHGGGHPVFQSCVFSVNVADYSGGAIRFHDGGGEVRGCLFLGNKAGDKGDGTGGALAMDDPSPESPRAVTVVNSTFVGNLTAGALGSGGAIHNRVLALAVANSIFWDNGTAANKGGSYALLDETGTATASHSDVQGGLGGGFTGGGNIDAPPYAAAPWDYPYLLAPDSPCVDAGDNAAVPAALIDDFEGHPRIFGANDPATLLVDMGWDEYYDGEFSLTSPARGTRWLNDGTPRTIAWASANIPGDVRISLWRGSPGDGGTEVRLIAAAVPCAAGTYAWTMPTGLADRDDYTVVIQAVDLPALVAWGELATQHLQLLWPNRGGLYQGGSYAIKWASGGLSGALVRIELFDRDRRALTLAAGAPNTGKYAWKVPFTLLPGYEYRIRVSTTRPRAAVDFSDHSFRVLPALTLTAPDGGEVWKRGTAQVIAWMYRNNPGETVRLDLFRNGVPERTIAASVPRGTGGRGSYRWRIPATLEPGLTYTVKVRSVAWPKCFDFSAYSFQVTE